ncbi:MAG TPA: tetratricopeptide repeat protein [Labilithrix sp.]
MKFKAVGAGLGLVVGVLLSTGGAVAQESGVGEARDAAKKSPASADAALAYGRALRRAGRDNDALTELRRAEGLTGGKADVAAHVEWEIARTHIAKRDFQAALATCRGFEKLHKPASRVCAAEAHLLWRRGTEATAELAEVKDTSGLEGDVGYFAKIAEGRIRELEAKDADAETDFRAAVALAPKRPDAHMRLGVALGREGKDGTSELKRAVELDAHDPVAQYELGRALAAGTAASLTALEHAVAERPTYTDALRALAEGYVAAKRLPDAKKTAEAILKIAPNDVFSHVVAGRVSLAEGKTDDALKEGETASNLMPNAAAAKLLVADAQAKKGEIDLAIEAYQIAFGLDRTSPTALVNAAEACVAANRPTSAKAFARRATQDFPNHGPAWIALGDALAADKDSKGARSAYESAKKSKDVDAAMIDKKIGSLP